MGGSSKQATQQTTSTQLPAWVTAAGQNNYNTAAGIASNPNALYVGPTQVGSSGLQDQAYAEAAGNAGTIQPQVQGVLATQQTNNLTPYMNPYTQDVVNTSEKALSDSLAQSQMANDSQSLANNAFGGSRAGVQAGVTAAQGAQQAGQLAAQLNSANYNQAQGQLNANTGLQLSGLSQLSGLNSSDLTNLLGAGAVQQQGNQNLLNSQIAQYNAPTTNREQLLGLLQSSLGQTPYDTTTNSSGTTTKSSSPDFATAGLGLLKLGAGFL